MLNTNTILAEDEDGPENAMQFSSDFENQIRCKSPYQHTVLSFIPVLLVGADANTVERILATFPSPLKGYTLKRVEIADIDTSLNSSDVLIFATFDELESQGIGLCKRISKDVMEMYQRNPHSQVLLNLITDADLKKILDKSIDKFDKCLKYKN